MDVDETRVQTAWRRTFLGAAVETPATDRPAARTFNEGDLVAARFRVVAFLGHGGMGEVYEAEDLELADRVALKTISSEGPFNPVAVEQFRREIHLARRITHPNVCRVHDVVRHATPRGELLVLSMELLRGETLRERLRRADHLPLREALAIVGDVASGLEAMHAASIIHRDLKSGNVMIVPDGRRPSGTRAVVMDFGLARHFTESAEVAEAPIMGTPAYMAPEQFAGGHVGPPADIYALGVMLFELVCGRLPFEDESPLSGRLARLHVPPPRPRELSAGVPAAVEALILRCLARNPADRYASASAVLAALGDFGDGTATRQKRVGRVLAAVAGAAAVALTAAVLWSALASRGDARSTAAPPVGSSAVQDVDVAMLRAQSKTALERGDLAAAFEALARAKAARPGDPEIDRDLATLLTAAQQVVGRLRELDALNDYLTAQMQSRTAGSAAPSSTGTSGGPPEEAAAPLLAAALQAVQAAVPAPQIPTSTDARDAVIRTLRAYYDAIERGDVKTAQELNPKADLSKLANAERMVYVLQVMNVTIAGTTSRVTATLRVDQPKVGRPISREVEYELQYTGTRWIIVSSLARDDRR